jgi:hypothetical protein
MAGISWSFLIHDRPQILSKVLALGTPVGDLATVSGGATVTEAYGMKEAIVEEKSLEATMTPVVPFVVSGNLRRYGNSWLLGDTQYIKTTYLRPYLILNHLSVSERRREQSLARKLIISGMARRPTVFLDEDGIAAAKSTVIVYEPALSLGYLASILNSALLAYIYHGLFRSLALGGGFLRFGPPQIRALPIRPIDFTTPERHRVQLLVEGKRLIVASIDGQSADQEFHVFLSSEVGEWTQTRLEAEPEQSDVIHDLLAYLAEQMINMHREKQAEVKGFLDWLAGYTGLPIEEWRLKTVVKSYWDHGWDEIQRVLRENRKAIEKANGRNVEGREALEAIQGEYDRSVAKLEPLLQRIASTDRLIDLIVYRLYGLTEEEVAIVEGE